MGSFKHGLIFLAAVLLCPDAAPAGMGAAVTRPPPATLSTLPSEWSAILKDLRLRFVDPETSRVFTAAGPFEILSESVGRIVALGASVDGSTPAHLTIVARGSGLWAVARFESHEFAARIR